MEEIELDALVAILLSHTDHCGSCTAACLCADGVDLVLCITRIKGHESALDSALAA